MARFTFTNQNWIIILLSKTKMYDERQDIIKNIKVYNQSKKYISEINNAI